MEEMLETAHCVREVSIKRTLTDFKLDAMEHICPKSSLEWSKWRITILDTEYSSILHST